MPAPLAVTANARNYIAAAKLNPVERQLLQGVMARHQISISQALRLGLQLANKA